MYCSFILSYSFLLFQGHISFPLILDLSSFMNTGAGIKHTEAKPKLGPLNRHNGEIRSFPYSKYQNIAVKSISSETKVAEKQENHDIIVQNGPCSDASRRSADGNVSFSSLPPSLPLHLAPDLHLFLNRMVTLFLSLIVLTHLPFAEGCGCLASTIKTSNVPSCICSSTSWEQWKWALHGLQKSHSQVRWWRYCCSIRIFYWAMVLYFWFSSALCLTERCSWCKCQHAVLWENRKLMRLFLLFFVFGFKFLNIYNL